MRRNYKDRTALKVDTVPPCTSKKTPTDAISDLVETTFVMQATFVVASLLPPKPGADGYGVKLIYTQIKPNHFWVNRK